VNLDQAEVYAGFTEQTDFEVGRLLSAIREEGKADNTVVLEIFGDNGASAEGGLEGIDARDVKRQAKAVRGARRSCGPARKRALHEPLCRFVGMGAELSVPRHEAGCVASGRNHRSVGDRMARTYRVK